VSDFSRTTQIAGRDERGGHEAVLGTQNLPLFIASGILLNLTPGQDTLYIVGRSVSQGRRAGVVSVLGITSGSIVHTTAAAFGLSAILATSRSAFLIVRLAGAMYLAYLGVKMLLERRGGPGGPVEWPREDAWSIYRSGVLTNLLNPKVALFFLAFLPQFVSPAAPSRVLAFLFLGGVFMTTGTAWCLVLAWFGSALSGRFRRNASTGRRLRQASGALFVALGVKLAISR
jgi:threonine/homoserine/homoserine lactone efflux protein